MEAATATSQAELTPPPLPHLCSASSPPARHASAGSELTSSIMEQMAQNIDRHAQNPAGLFGGENKTWSKGSILTSLSHKMCLKVSYLIHAFVSVSKSIPCFFYTVFEKLGLIRSSAKSVFLTAPMILPSATPAEQKTIGNRANRKSRLLHLCLHKDSRVDELTPQPNGRLQLHRRRPPSELLL